MQFNFRPIAQAYLLAFGYEQHFSKKAVPGEPMFYLQSMKALGMFDPYEFGMQLGSALEIETNKPHVFGKPIVTYVAKKMWMNYDQLATTDTALEDYRRRMFRAYLSEGSVGRYDPATLTADLFYVAGRTDQKYTYNRSR
jgi:hypothetical protein